MRATAVAVYTSHASSSRRRASRYTQYATPSQNTATTNSDRLRATANAVELKMSCSPDPVTRCQCPPSGCENTPDRGRVVSVMSESDDRRPDHLHLPGLRAR